MEDTLVNSGASAAKQFLEGWDFDEYVEKYRLVDLTEPSMSPSP